MHLNLQDVQRCRVCDNGKGLCAKGKCVIEDDFTQLYEQVVAAEAVVWITPVYWHDMAEPLKAFFDRLRRCETSHNHFLQNKKCILVAAAGGSGNGAIRCLHLMEDTLGHMKMEIRDRLPVTKFSRDYMLQALKASANSLCKEI